MSVSFFLRNKTRKMFHSQREREKLMDILIRIYRGCDEKFLIKSLMETKFYNAVIKLKKISQTSTLNQTDAEAVIRLENQLQSFVYCYFSFS